MSRRAMMVKVGGLAAGTYYITRAIDHTKLASENRTDDLVFVVDATFTAMKSVGNGGHVQYTNGADIHVTDSTGTTEWTFYLDAYDPTTGHVVLFIKPPGTTSGSSDRTYRIAYGDASMTVSLSNSANTFPASIFDFVHGFDDNGSGGIVVTDRSANGFNATNHNGATLDTTGGLVNGGAALNRASTQYYSIAYNAAQLPDATHPKLILTTIITGSSYPAFMPLLSRQNSVNEWHGLALDTSGHAYGFANFRAGFIDCIGTTVLSTSTRYTLAFYLSFATNGAKVFVNGTKETQVNAAFSNRLDNPDTIIGNDSFNAGRAYNGTIGEMWQITGTRSEAFITTYSNALYDPSTFSTGTTETSA